MPTILARARTTAELVVAPFVAQDEQYEPVREVASRERTDSWVEAAAEAGAPPQNPEEVRRQTISCAQINCR